MVGAAVAGGGGMAISWLVAVGLGTEYAGQFFAATSAFLLAGSIARLGVPTGLVYWIARVRHNDNGPSIPAILLCGLIPPAAVSILVAVLGLWCAEWIADGHTGATSTYAAILRALAVFLPFAVALEALLAATRGFGRMRATVVTDKLGRTIAQLGLLLVAVWQHAGPVAITLAWSLPYLPASAAALWWLFRRKPLAPAAVTHSRQSLAVTARQFWVYTAPRALAGVAQIVLQRLDILLVASLVSFSEAAIYTVATRFIALGQLIAGAIGTAVQPRLAASMARYDVATSQTLYQTTTGWIIATTWPFYLIVALAASWYLKIFGNEYHTSDAVQVVWILAAGMLVATATGVVDSMLVMAGRTSWQLYNVVVAVVVNVVIDIWLIPNIGILGAAIGWATAITINNVLPLLQLAIVFKLHPFGQGALLAIVLSLACCGAIPALLGMGGDLGLAWGIVIAVLAYAASAWRGRKTLTWPGNRKQLPACVPTTQKSSAIQKLPRSTPMRPTRLVHFPRKCLIGNDSGYVDMWRKHLTRPRSTMTSLAAQDESYACSTVWCANRTVTTLRKPCWLKLVNLIHPEKCTWCARLANYPTPQNTQRLSPCFGCYLTLLKRFGNVRWSLPRACFRIEMRAFWCAKITATLARSATFAPWLIVPTPRLGSLS